MTDFANTMFDTFAAMINLILIPHCHEHASPTGTKTYKHRFVPICAE